MAKQEQRGGGSLLKQPRVGPAAARPLVISPFVAVCEFRHESYVGSCAPASKPRYGARKLVRHLALHLWHGAAHNSDYLCCVTVGSARPCGSRPSLGESAERIGPHD